MKILGIDPGLDITGYGLIEKKGQSLAVIEAGIIRTQSRNTLSARLKKLYSQVMDIIVSHKPDICVIEQLYSHYKHPMTSVQHDVLLKEYPAKTPKRAVTGNGNASKLQVQRVINKILNLPDTPCPLDVTDALSLCLTYIYHADKESRSIRNLNGIDSQDNLEKLRARSARGMRRAKIKAEAC